MWSDDLRPAGRPNEGTQYWGRSTHYGGIIGRCPRYDDSLAPEQRKDARNGIWLCENFAKRVDNDEAQFLVEYLRAWKTMREINVCRE